MLKTRGPPELRTLLTRCPSPIYISRLWPPVFNLLETYRNPINSFCRFILFP